MHNYASVFKDMVFKEDWFQVLGIHTYRWGSYFVVFFHWKQSDVFLEMFRRCVEWAKDCLCARTRRAGPALRKPCRFSKSERPNLFENSNRPLEHTPDPKNPPVYEGNPFHICILGYLGYVPRVCWDFLRSTCSDMLKSEWMTCPYDKSHI